VSFRLEYTLTAKQQIQTLPTRKIQDQIENALLRLSKNPDLGKRLKGDLKDLWSYRSGDYRVIYQVFRSEIRILILALGDRKHIYKKL
jgi:mRNA interferase RelE/StbE